MLAARGMKYQHACIPVLHLPLPRCVTLSKRHASPAQFILKLLLKENGGGEEPLPWVAWSLAKPAPPGPSGQGQLRMRVSSQDP